MTRTRSLFTGIILTVVVGFGPTARAQTVKAMIAGVPQTWQTLALGTYKVGKCIAGGVAPCFHYTSSVPFNLTDTRPSLKNLPAVSETGALWLVWDSAARPNVWAYIKASSVTANRCYFASPACNVNVSSFPAPGNLINNALWGDSSADAMPPAAIQALFTGGSPVKVNVAATDLRPEDALFAQCRANSVLGNGSPGTGDGLDGLGYNANNAPGACPQFGASASQLVGSAILGGYPGSVAQSNLVAFDISGQDPFSGASILPSSTAEVGAAPLVFVFSRNGGQLAGLIGANQLQLQQVFSGTNCDAAIFGLPSAPIFAYLQDPTSGDMNTAEAGTFRLLNGTAALGPSQESGINATNPVQALPCAAGPQGNGRSRAVKTGEEIRSVLNSTANSGVDGIGYADFSYGNVAPIANNTSYGYIALGGSDPIFANYNDGNLLNPDPGQPSLAGALPSAANLPSSCAGAFPCPETAIWAGGLSFPNLRNGEYPAWSMLRLVGTGAPLAIAKLMAASAQQFVVSSVPDFVPFAKVGTTDPGLAIFRSHYLQSGVAPNNGIKTPVESGGDMAGCILTDTSERMSKSQQTECRPEKPEYAIWEKGNKEVDQDTQNTGEYSALVPWNWDGTKASLVKDSDVAAWAQKIINGKAPEVPQLVWLFQQCFGGGMFDELNALVPQADQSGVAAANYTEFSYRPIFTGNKTNFAVAYMNALDPSNPAKLFPGILPVAQPLADSASKNDPFGPSPITTPPRVPKKENQGSEHPVYFSTGPGADVILVRPAFGDKNATIAVMFAGVPHRWDEMQFARMINILCQPKVGAYSYDRIFVLYGRGKLTQNTNLIDLALRACPGAPPANQSLDHVRAADNKQLNNLIDRFNAGPPYGFPQRVFFFADDHGYDNQRGGGKSVDQNTSGESGPENQLDPDEDPKNPEPKDGGGDSGDFPKDP